MKRSQKFSLGTLMSALQMSPTLYYDFDLYRQRKVAAITGEKL